MLVENEFTSPAPVDHLWAYLLDVERVAPCLPGAELTETIDDRNWKGKVLMKLGPVSLSFAGSVAMDERDDVGHRVVLHAKGMEQKGKGAANAVVTSWLEPGEGVTTVKMRADITLTGPVAQLSRGLLPDISKKLTQQFADCLQASMAASEAVAAPNGADVSDSNPDAKPGDADAAPSGSRAIGGFRLGAWALVRAVGRFFGRLFGQTSR
ncbi:MAG: SRPBCC family protein [Actinomycetota bacterium]